ncbi:hypothetical protein Tco_1356601, partial [Tanacetum coccineum]
MCSIDDIKSILTQSALDALCEKFHIPDIVHPELPGRNDRIRNSLTGKIGVYTRFFDFANYRIPFSQFLVDVLVYFQINLSQLSVIAAAKISHFEILCRVHNFVSIVGNFRRFYINSKNKEMDLFAFIHHVNPTKVRIWEREFAEGEDVGAHVVNKESGDAAVADQIKESDHVVRSEGANIVRIEDEVPVTVAEKAKGARKKRKATGKASVSNLPPKKLRADHGTSSAVASTGGKSVAALQDLL